MSGQKTSTNYDVPAIGGTENYTLGRDVDVNYVDATGGAVTIAAHMNITTADTPKEGNSISFVHTGGVTSDVSGGKAMKYFGTSMTDEEALIECDVTCNYKGGVWIVRIKPSMEATNALIVAGMIASDAVTTAKILDDNVTLAKIADLSSGGYIIQSAAGGGPAELDASTSAYILMGQGANLPMASVPITGPVLYTKGGVGTLQNSSVDVQHLAFGIPNTLRYERTFSAAEIIACFATPHTLLSAPGGNLAIKLTEGSMELDYGTAAFVTGTQLRIKTDTATQLQATCDFPMGGVADQNGAMTLISEPAAGTSMYISNKSLVLTTDLLPATGDSSIKIVFYYRIINTLV